ncbi:TPA: RNA polymerase sigma factor, partial [Klebsiella michiganensis]
MTTSGVRQHLAAHLTRLWRYGLVLVVEELVQSACVRALEK